MPEQKKSGQNNCSTSYLFCGCGNSGREREKRRREIQIAFFPNAARNLKRLVLLLQI